MFTSHISRLSWTSVACLWIISFGWIGSFVRGDFVPFKTYAGDSFFDGFDFYGDVDNTTWGNVTYLSEPNARSAKLAYVDNGHAFIRVDNTTDIPTSTPGFINRPSIRITTKDPYPIGSLLIADILHIPYGCSVWPALWTTGEDWPHGGEIDIIEAINGMTNNQMAIHTDPGCTKDPASSQQPAQLGHTIFTDCAPGSGCTVGETKPNSYGEKFVSNGGGVWAMQFDVSGIYMWFWPRQNIPQSISSTASNPTANMVLSDWGPPSAAYPATTCDIAKFFTAQKLVIDISLCGVWAGIPNIYSQTCPGTCISNIYGTGNPVYNNAYWEISSIRSFLAPSTTPPSSSAPNNGPQSTTTQTQTFTAKDSGQTGNGGNAPSGDRTTIRTGGVSLTALLASLIIGFIGL